MEIILDLLAGLHTWLPRVRSLMKLTPWQMGMSSNGPRPLCKPFLQARMATQSQGQTLRLKNWSYASRVSSHWDINPSALYQTQGQFLGTGDVNVTQAFRRKPKGLYWQRSRKPTGPKRREKLGTGAQRVNTVTATMWKTRRTQKLSDPPSLSSPKNLS